MIATGWSSGSPNHATGSGYGIRISHSDRDRYFRHAWPYVTIEIEGFGAVEASISPSFWRKCSELRNRTIGQWMIEHRLAPWPKGSPPKFRLAAVGERHFRLDRG